MRNWGWLAAAGGDLWGMLGGGAVLADFTRTGQQHIATYPNFATENRKYFLTVAAGICYSGDKVNIREA